MINLEDKTVLSCPCCGNGDLYVGVTAFGYYGVQCNNCGLKVERSLPEETESTWYNTQVTTLLSAVKAWNKRTKEKRPAVLLTNIVEKWVESYDR